MGAFNRLPKFVHALDRHHLIGSMGHVGTAVDNAAMESVFALLQENVLDRKHWRTREELHIAIIPRKWKVPPPGSNAPTTVDADNLARAA